MQLIDFIKNSNTWLTSFIILTNSVPFVINWFASFTLPLASSITVGVINWSQLHFLLQPAQTFLAFPAPNQKGKWVNLTAGFGTDCRVTCEQSFLLLKYVGQVILEFGCKWWFQVKHKLISKTYSAKLIETQEPRFWSFLYFPELAEAFNRLQDEYSMQWVDQ